MTGIPRWWLAFDPLPIADPVPDREIRRIVLHCSATPAGRDVRPSAIKRWHTDPPPDGNGWKDIGYHYVVTLDGKVHKGRPEHQVGAHVAGHNADSIGICYVGGLSESGAPADTRTAAQVEATDRLIAEIRERHGQQVTVHGHNEFSAKACPSFDVQADRRARRR